MENKEIARSWINNLKAIAKAYDYPTITSCNDSLSMKIIDNELYIGVAGSNGNLKDWFGATGNLRTKQKKINKLNKSASSGFVKSAIPCFKELKSQLQGSEFTKINIAGHSRGGPIASIIACLAHEEGMFSKIKLTTFGAPRWTTDERFNDYKFIRDSDRVVSAGDKIAEIPFSTRFNKFIHFGNFFLMGSEKNRHIGNMFDYYDAHMLATYQTLCYEALEDYD